MTKHSNERKRIEPPKMIMMLTILTTIIVMCFSFSKYESTIAGTSKTTVALMTNSVTTELNDIMGKPRRCFYM